jgi:hypothetical protein
MRHSIWTMHKLRLTYIWALVVALFAFSQKGLSQFDKSIYSSYKATADSIVQLYYSDRFSQFIIIDSTTSYYRTLKTGGGGTMTELVQPLKFEPEMFAFHYYFKCPCFNGDTLNIKFYIDKNHRIMEGFSPEGLFDMKNQTELNIISKDRALEIAKKEKIKKPLSMYEIEFGWHEQEVTTDDYKKFNQTNDIKNIVKGRIVWLIKSKFRVAPVGDEKPYAETFLIDAITGVIIGIVHDTIIWG